MKNLLSIFLINLLIVSLTWGQNAKQKEAIPTDPQPSLSTTKQNVTIDGVTIPLMAKAGTMELRDENNEPIALFGYTSYVKSVSNKKGINTSRPIVFSYNGGPGSSSFWLHMGVLGPKRIVVNDPDFTPAAPYEITNNNWSILDVADLVMIDPVGTGLSVPIGKAEFKDFWGVDQDIRSISLFITQYLKANGRFNSPKYLLGESYGTFRNAGVMDKLLSQGIAMNGVIMVSAVFDLRTLMFPPNDDLPYIVHFPTYAATAWYHDKIPNKTADFETFIQEIREFTENEYTPALFKGDQLSAVAKQNMADKLAAYTGLSSSYWMRADLRVTNSEFFAEFLRDERGIVGRLDARYRGINLDAISQRGDHDPQSSAISPAYISGFLDYFHGELGVDPTLNYSITAGRRKGFKWDWSHRGNTGWGTQTAINTGNDMARAMTRDPNMKVLILNGYYDIATVFYGVEHSINHLGLPPDIKKNIIMKYYEAGHMMYTDQASLEQFKKDVATFILDTSTNRKR